LNILNFPDTWLEPLGKGFCQDFLDEMESKFLKLQAKNISILPPDSSIFRALELVHFLEAKVLILGTRSLSWFWSSKRIVIFCK
jgi:uracil DNA glycosylase